MTNFKITVFSILLFFTFQEASAQLIGIIYEDNCYEDNSQSIDQSDEILMNGLTFGDDNIHSVKMHSNRHFIRLYEHNDYGGEYRDIYSDMPNLGSIGFDDETTSLKAFPSETTLPGSREPKITSTILNGRKILDNSFGKGIPFRIPRSDVDWANKIYIKGLARNTTTQSPDTRFVVTGSTGDEPDKKSYIFVFNEEGQKLSQLPLSGGELLGAAIPSSTQMVENVFPVSSWNPNTGMSQIRFYRLTGNNVAIVPNSQFINVNARIESLSYSTINGKSYLLGSTLGAQLIYIWESPFVDFQNPATSNYVNTAAGIIPSQVIDNLSSISQSWPSYHAYWLGKMEEDGRVVLVATHSKWADVWEVHNIDDPTPTNFQLNKIHAEHVVNFNAGGDDLLRRGTSPFFRPEDGGTVSFSAIPEDFGSDGTNSHLASNYREVFYEGTFCDEQKGCPIPANVGVTDTICDGKEAWLNIWNDDYTYYRITICTERNGNCINEVSTGYREGPITNQYRKMDELYKSLTTSDSWCNNSIIVTVDLLTKDCAEPSTEVLKIFKSCAAEINISVPTNVCDKHPVMLVDNGSQNYTEYKYSICLINDEGDCKNWLTSGWIEGQIPSNGIDLLAEYLRLADNAGKKWRFWCNNSYRVQLAMRNECDSWEAVYPEFFVECEPCPEFIQNGKNGDQSKNEDSYLSRMTQSVQENEIESSDFKFDIVANPFRDEAKFELSVKGDQKLSLRLINIDGKVVKELISQKNYQQGTYIETFDLSQLTDGIYFYQVLSKNNRKSGSIIKNSSAF